MTKSTITFRTDENRKAALDALAKTQQRNRSFLINEALDHYIDVQSWHVEHIQKGVEQLDRGEFVSHEEVKDKFAELLAKCK